MKIDPKLKNRIRFNQLEADARDRLRQFYHLTSAAAALRIVESGYIWSDAPDLCPNFTPNRKSRSGSEEGTDSTGDEAEICLRFQFSGSAHLVAEDTPASSYAPNALYLHLYEWPDLYGLQGMRVALVRVSAPTASGLECTGFQASPAFLAQCKTDIASTLLLTRIKRLTGLSRSIRVPADAAQRAAIAAEFPEPHFGWMERTQMRLMLWQRRLRKRYDR